MAQLILTRGIPASGKTTWALAWVAEAPTRRVRLNRDGIRATAFGFTEKGVGTPEQENMVTTILEKSVRGLLQAGYDVVVDDTNLTNRYVKRWFKVWDDIVFHDFQIDLERALNRNWTRQDPVDEQVIRNMYKRTDNGKLKPPPVQEVKVREFKPYIPDPHKPIAFGFDLDGTLAHMDGRGPYDTHLYHTDRIDLNVFRVLDQLANNARILIFTGRSEDYRIEVEAWLKKNGVWHDELIMRKSGDYRRDDIVKSELFDEFVAPYYNFIMQFDDRDRVVDGLRAKGIKVAQVERGDF